MTRPRSGDVWRYDYLWRWQHEAGETEGRKRRPVAMAAVVLDKDGRSNLFILAITSTPPSPERLALAVPQIERRRAGLDDIPLWVIVDEYNFDIVESSFYFDPNARVGRLSDAFYKTAMGAFVSAVREKRTRKVPRTD